MDVYVPGVLGRIGLLVRTGYFEILKILKFSDRSHWNFDNRTDMKDCRLTKAYEDEKMTGEPLTAEEWAGNRVCGCVRKERVIGLTNRLTRQAKSSIMDCADFCGGKLCGKICYMVSFSKLFITETSSCTHWTYERARYVCSNYKDKQKNPQKTQ